MGEVKRFGKHAAEPSSARGIRELKAMALRRPTAAAGESVSSAEMPSIPVNVL